MLRINKTFSTTAILAAILIILFYQSLFCGQGLLPSDGIFQYLPWSRTTDSTPSNYLLADQYNVYIPQHQFVQREIAQGSFPLWNPHLNCGAPNLAAYGGALLFPIQVLVSPIDPFYARGIAAFLKLFLAGLFTILYLRRLGASHPASLLAGIIFSLCGFMIVWLGHPQVNTAMWLPLLLYFIEKQFSTPSLPGQDESTTNPLRGWIGFSIAYGFMLLGGHPPTAIHVTIFVTCYFFFRLARQNQPKRTYVVAAFLCSSVVGMFLSAPQLLPYLEYYRLSSSALSSAAVHRATFHLDPNNLIHFLFPYVSGSPVTGFEDLPRHLGLAGIDDFAHNFNERTGYVGVLTILLASCGVFFYRSAFSMFFLTSSVVSLLIIFGMPPFPFIMHHVPILQNINHVRLFMILAFSMAVLAGFGLDSLCKIEQRRQKVILIVGFWVTIGIVVTWFFGTIWPQLTSLDGPSREYLYLQIPIFAGALIVSILILLLPKHRFPMVTIVLCLTWTAVDLLWFAKDYNPSITSDRHYPSTSAIEFIKKDTSLFRILGLGNVLAPNTAAVYDLHDVRGCDYMSVRRYEELITGTAGNFFFFDYAQDLPKAFPLLNVKYVITSEPLRTTPPQFELVYANEVAVYRYVPYLERALIVFDYTVIPDPEKILSIVRDESFRPREVLLLEEEPFKQRITTSPVAHETSVRIFTYRPDDILIEASLPRPGFLLLLDTDFPGWHATTNGESTRIYRADYNFRAVFLPAGKSMVHFTYKPASLRIGFIISLIGILILAAAWFFKNVPLRKSKPLRNA